jgi:outer membrane receptor protein involved in Fe transport
MKRLLSVAVSLIMCIRLAFSQQTVRGVVMDANSLEPLIGVSVMDMQGKTGTVTQSNGTFALKISNPEDSLLITYTGYHPQTVKAGKNKLIISLRSSLTALNELVVTASRTAQKRTDVPVAISVISPQMMQQTKAVTLDQVLNKVSGVYMVNLGNEQHTMDIRQPMDFGSNYLYMEDGIPIRTIGDFNHNALLEINQADVEKIEVVKGPSSALYGSDAVGGAVNFISKKPAAVPDAELTVQGSTEGYKRADFTASNTFKNTGVLISGYDANQHGGYISHNNFHKLALTGRIDQQISEKAKLTGQLTWIHYYSDMPGGLDSARFYGKDYQTPYTFTYRKVNAWRSRITWEQDWNNRQQSELTFYYRNNAIGQNPFYRVKTTSNPLKANGEINNDFFQSYGTLGQYNWRFPWWNTHLMAGFQAELTPAGYVANYIDINRDSQGEFINYTKTDSLLADYKVNMVNAAGFVRVQTSPVENLRLVAGLRYDMLNYDFTNHLPATAYSGSPNGVNNFSQVTPKAGFTYDFGNDKGIYANYSIGFAPPDMSDLYYGVKIPVLKPARFFNYETGGWMSFDNHKGYLDISLYRMNGRNEIVSERLGNGLQVNQNAGKTLHYGVEYSLHYQPFTQWQLRISGTNVNHRYIEYIQNGKNFSGNEMSDAPHWIMNAEITYDPSFIQDFDIAAEWQHISSYWMDQQNTKRYPGYDVFNLRINYTWNKFELWAKLINVFNANYATIAQKTAYNTTYTPGLLRTLYVGIGYHFTGHNKK